MRHSLTHEPDYILFGVFLGLLAFGLLMLMSASAPVGYQRFGDSYFFIKRQLIFGALPGIVLFFVFAKIEYHSILRFSVIIFIAVNALLLLVFIPGLGSKLNTGSRSWIALSSYSMQPSEFAKFSIILFLAALLGSRRFDLSDIKHGFIPAFAIGFIPILFVLFQPDIGTGIVLFTILFGMLYIAGARIAHLSMILLLGIIGFALLILAAPYRLARLTTFLHPELDPIGKGYQINQAYLAIGSGGFFGLGLGHSRQKFQYLPEVHADSIFAIIAEEMGFFIVVGYIVLLLFIALRSVKIARFSPDEQGRLLAGGIILWFITQSFFNIGAMVGILPLTGIPLSFVSHGGTALMVSLAGAGVLVNISKYTDI